LLDSVSTKQLEGFVMTRPRKPWFRKSNKRWYVEFDGKQVNLGPDRAVAQQRFHELMAQPKKQAVASDSVAAICDAFLEWSDKNRAPDTYRWYKDRLQAFLLFAPSGLLVNDLKPFHVQNFIDSLTVKSGTKRNYVRAIKRAMKWATEQGYIDRSPIAYLKQPKQGRRDNVVPEADHKRILKLTKDQGFRDLVTFSWETGARAIECFAIESRHFDAALSRIVLPIEEEKMERAPRIIYLTNEASEIIARLARRFPNGKLFRNTRGVPWDANNSNCRFRYLARKLGVKYCLTDYRHTFATRLLTSGVDALTVSILLGHADTSMLSRVYAHINHDHRYLKDALCRLRRSKPSL